MTQRSLDAHIKGFELIQKRRDEELWLQGQYVREAILSTIGNSTWFKDKNTEMWKYPEKPISQQKAEKEHVLTEWEIEHQRALFVKRARERKEKFDKYHKK